MQDSIKFRLTFLNESIEVNCRRGEFRNLMVLINEKMFVPDFGECKGIGRCGTCLVNVQSKIPLPSSNRNEMATLAKCAVQEPEVRLSCQIMIDEFLDGAEIYICEEREDVR